MPVSIPEAAQALGISIDEVRRQMRTGELKSAQISTPDGLGMGVMLPDEQGQASGGPAPGDPGPGFPPAQPPVGQDPFAAPLLDPSATAAPPPQPPPSPAPPPQPAMPDFSGLGGAPSDQPAGAPGSQPQAPDISALGQLPPTPTAPGMFQDPGPQPPTATPPTPSAPTPPTPDYGFTPPPAQGPLTPGGFADPDADVPTTAPPPTDIPSGPDFGPEPPAESPITAEPPGGVAGEQGQTVQAGREPSRELVNALHAQVAAQMEELEARRREVQELHVLLQQLQTRALPSPESQGGFSEQPVSRPPSSQSTPAGPKKVPWWRFTRSK